MQKKYDISIDMALAWLFIAMAGLMFTVSLSVHFQIPQIPNLDEALQSEANLFNAGTSLLAASFMALVSIWTLVGSFILLAIGGLISTCSNSNNRGSSEGVKWPPKEAKKLIAKRPKTGQQTAAVIRPDGKR